MKNELDELRNLIKTMFSSESDTMLTSSIDARMDKICAKAHDRTAHFLWITYPFEIIDPVRLMYINIIKKLLENKNAKCTILILDLFYRYQMIVKKIREYKNHRSTSSYETIRNKIYEDTDILIGKMIKFIKNFRIDIKDTRDKGIDITRCEFFLESYVYSNNYGKRGIRYPIEKMAQYCAVKGTGKSADAANGRYFYADYMAMFYDDAEINSDFIITSADDAKIIWDKDDVEILNEMSEINEPPTVLPISVLPISFKSPDINASEIKNDIQSFDAYIKDPQGFLQLITRQILCDDNVKEIDLDLTSKNIESRIREYKEKIN